MVVYRGRKVRGYYFANEDVVYQKAKSSSAKFDNEVGYVDGKGWVMMRSKTMKNYFWRYEKLKFKKEGLRCLISESIKTITSSFDCKAPATNNNKDPICKVEIECIDEY